MKLFTIKDKRYRNVMHDVYAVRTGERGKTEFQVFNGAWYRINADIYELSEERNMSRINEVTTADVADVVIKCNGIQCPMQVGYNVEKCNLGEQCQWYMPVSSDVVEVKHGHWIRVHAIEMYGGDPNDWNSYAECAVACSECGNDFELEAHEYSFCPNCGARMDGAE